MNDHIAFLTGWAADIRASSGPASVDADCLEASAKALRHLVEENEQLREALRQIAGESGQFGFPWPETHVDYPAFALLTARNALKEPA